MPPDLLAAACKCASHIMVAAACIHTVVPNQSFWASYATDYLQRGVTQALAVGRSTTTVKYKGNGEGHKIAPQ